MLHVGCHSGEAVLIDPQAQPLWNVAVLWHSVDACGPLYTDLSIRLTSLYNGAQARAE